MKTFNLFTIVTVVLFSTMTNAQTQNKITKIPPRYAVNNEPGTVKARIAAILEKETKWIQDPTNGAFGSPKDIVVLDDRIECKIKNKKTVIRFSDLIDCPIELEEFSQTGADNKFYLVRYQVDLKYFMIYFKMDERPAMQFTNDMYFIQRQMREKLFASQLTKFEPIAAAYCELKVKPAVYEEQRKFIVKANSFNQSKNYVSAIQSYTKANEINLTAYPPAYSNLALLSAQISKFDAAIFYMKEYLLLEPESADTRSAQDKICEWEISLNQ